MKRIFKKEMLLFRRAAGAALGVFDRRDIAPCIPSAGGFAVLRLRLRTLRALYRARERGLYILTSF